MNENNGKEQKRIEIDLTLASASYKVDYEGSQEKIRRRDNSAVRKTKSEEGALAAVFAVAEGLSEYKLTAADQASFTAVSACRDNLFNIESSGDIDVENSIRGIYNSVNRKIYDLGTGEAVRVETTLVCGFLLGGRMTVAQVGHSNAFRFYDGAIERVTTERNTSVPDSENPEEMISLDWSLGGDPEDTEHIYFSHFFPKPGEVLIFCSDGVTKALSDGEINVILSSGKSPSVICEEIVDVCEERNKDDDSSVVYVKFNEPEGDSDQKEKGIDTSSVLKAQPSPCRSRNGYDGLGGIALILSIIVLILSFVVQGMNKGSDKGMPGSEVKFSPYLILVSAKDLQSVEYNEIQIGDLFKGDRGAVRLKYERNDFTIHPSGGYSLVFTYPGNTVVGIKSAEENVIYVNDRRIMAGIRDDCSIEVRDEGKGYGNSVRINVTQGPLRISLPAGQGAKVNILDE